MKNGDTLKKIVSKSVDEIFAFVNILKILSKISTFREWLKTYHKIEDDSDILEGYKFLLLTSLKCLINGIVQDRSLELAEDYVFFRADFVGIPLRDIPNTCEKTIFIKNIWNLSRGIRKSQNWKELEVSLEDFKKLFIMFDKIYENIKPTKNLKKEDALKIATQFYTYIFLNDTHRGYPHGNIMLSIIDYPITKKILKDSFKGYVYALQYLWFNLQCKDEFEKSCLKDIHKANELFSKEAEDYIDLKIGIPISEEEIKEGFIKENLPEMPVEPLSEEDIKKLDKQKKELLEIKDWYALDKFFGKIQDEIIEPIEKSLKINLVFDPLLTIEKVDKSLYNEFLSKDNVKDPDYLNKKDKESIKKQLDYYFLWYEVNVLDTQKFIVFNGVPAFISTLIGSVKLSEYYENKEKVFVRIFKHPALSEDKCDYSYAILIEAFGSLGISDYSGWLVFFDCATDYSGFGGSLEAMARVFIENLKKNNQIDVKEILVDKDIFKEYLTEKSVSSAFDKIIYQTPLGRFGELSISEIKQKTENFINYFRGRFFEYIFHKWLTESRQNRQKYYNTKCDFYLDGEQIDCVGENKNRIDIFECKITLHTEKIDEIINKIKKKVKVVKNEKGNVIVNPYIVFFSKINPTWKSKLEENGINVIDNFENTINTDRVFDKIRKDILNILKFDFSKVI